MKNLQLAVAALLVAVSVGTDVCAQTQLKAEVKSQALQGGLQKQVYNIKLPAQLHMSQAQYDRAVQQYKADVERFYSDAKRYAAALQDYKARVGECTEDDKQYKEQVKRDQLSLNNIQLNIPATVSTNVPPPPTSVVPPTLPPPRHCCIKCMITGQCGHLGTGGGGTAGQAASTANMDRVQAQRMNAVQQGIAKSTAELQAGMAEQKAAATVAIDEQDVLRRQADIEKQFAGLKEQYDTLRVERDLLAGRIHPHK